MKEQDSDLHIVTSLDDIAWILNLRGDDIPCNPVFLSYLMVDMEGARLYANRKDFDEETLAYLSELRVELKDYDSFYTDVKALRNSTVLLEKARTNFETISDIDSSNTVIDEMLPSSLWKSRKNDVEIENMKKAHIKDGVAITNYLYFMKHAFDKDGKLTEEAKALLGESEINEWNTAAVLRISERSRRAI
jgi:Xaa-Pro aminopeptidase